MIDALKEKVTDTIQEVAEDAIKPLKTSKLKRIKDAFVGRKTISLNSALLAVTMICNEPAVQALLPDYWQSVMIATGSVLNILLYDVTKRRRDSERK